MIVILLANARPVALSANPGSGGRETSGSRLTRTGDVTTPTSNDNHDVPSHHHEDHPDEHGDSAMLIVESLIHALIEKAVITVEEALEILDLAADAKQALATDRSDPERSEKSTQLIDAISRSLQIDLSARCD